MGEQRGVRQGERRMPLREAADALGVSKDALRQRIRRGTLRSDKGEDGRVYVYVDASMDASHTEPEVEGSELADELRDRIRYLERQVEEEREARRRADTLLARLMDRVPELEAPQEASGGAESAGEEPESAEPRSDAPGAPSEAAGARRPWWRRILRG